MKAFTVRDAVNATGGRYYGPESALDNSITFVTGDSRVAKEGALFVAFVGARVDGHSFMAQCIEKGAACCLSEREPTEAEMPCIQVESSLRAIGKLAAWHRSRFDIPVVGITGSVGKTTTKEMVASV
ncbi:MAG: Mur ligase domain-containing protein, partial [Clostridia bacterium]|nr:Mur ligase domain-containing protein [Clostridia bacterium]